MRSEKRSEMEECEEKVWDAVYNRVSRLEKAKFPGGVRWSVPQI